MAINCIRRLDRYRIFRNFTWPATLADFKKFNLIYGWNGSGKTTLSRLFRSLEARANVTDGSVTFSINGQDVRGDGFDQVTECIRVFNRDFVAENVFTATNEVAPIYVIGRENIDKQKQVEKLRTQLREAQLAVQGARAAHSQAVRAEDGFCIERAKLIKESLSAGTNRFSNYNKATFRAKCASMPNANGLAALILADTDRDMCVAQAHSSSKPKVADFIFEYPDLNTLVADITAILGRTVVSATIESLRDAPAVAAWVRDGLALHKEHDATSCLFCTQSIPAARMKALENHFSEEFERLQTDIDEQLASVQAIVASTKSIAPPNKAELYDDLVQDYSDALTGFEADLARVEKFLVQVRDALTRKKASPFGAMRLDAKIPQTNTAFRDTARAALKIHNDETDAFDLRVETALSRFESHYVADASDQKATLSAAVNDAKRDLDEAIAAEVKISGDIQRLEREIISHREPAEELNKDLKAYLGHSELELTVQDTGYQITRNGQVADDLSEGERTAIAVLYFLKSLIDRSFDREHGVAVLDDPVSSLDANALYNAFGFIKARTQDIGQVFILTHNFAFFRAVREWLRNLRGPLKNQWFIYMVECIIGADGRAAVLREIDPLLRDYESEYHYLFAYIYRITQQTTASNLEAYLPAPGIARRVLETFLAFRVPGQHTLYSRMAAVQCDEAMRSRIYRFVQTHAHRDSVGDSDDDVTILSETKSVLNDIIAFIRAADADHCDQMIAVTTTNS